MTSTPRPGPVFLTGLPRCGSSWAGQVLSQGGRTRYVYEPFNHQWNRRLRGELRYLHYLPAGAEAPPALLQAARAAFKGRQTWRQQARAAYRGYWRDANRPRARLLIKDPTACLLSAWLQPLFEPQCVIVYRHPCAFASSVEQLGWNFQALRLRRQPLLMAEHLAPYEALLGSVRSDPWLSRGALWGATHRVLLNQAAQQAQWRMVSYEQLCLNPRAEFARLGDWLGLRLELDEKLFSASGANSLSDPGSTRRDSRRMPAVWQQRLSPGQADAVLGAAQAFDVGELLRNCTVAAGAS
jgi:hypothetical protein